MMSNVPRWEKSCSRLSWRCCTMPRISALSCQSSPIWVKCFTSNWIGRPRCTSNWLKMPALDFSSTACDRSVATISMRQPDSAGPASFRHIAIEYGSCPVEDAAHQMRKDRRAARACISAGHAPSRCKWSNGILSRKKKVSLVVIASTTSAVSASAPLLIFCTSSGMPGSADLARQRHQPAFDQILLVGGQVESGALFQKLAQILIVRRRHERSPENNRTSFGAI